MVRAVRNLGFCLACGVAIIGSLCDSALATTFVITDTLDSTNITSLRGAIIAANAAGGENMIILTGSSYPLTISGADEPGAYTGDLNITNGSLIIEGAAPATTHLDATGLGDRVFQVSSNAQLVLINLVIQGGSAPYFFDPAYTFDGESGGAIYNSGVLTLQDCAVVGNGCVYGGCGGGIYNNGNATLDECVISYNMAGTGLGPNNNGYGNLGGDGGGIYNIGTLVLANCLITSNQAGQGGVGGAINIGAPSGSGGAGGSGGGIWNSGSLYLDFCTVSENTAGDGGMGGGDWSGGAGGDGGSGSGIYNEGTLALNTCTVCGNQAGNGGHGGNAWIDDSTSNGGNGGGGGGICNNGGLSLISCTIVLNGTGVGGDGGVRDFDGYNPIPGAGGRGGNGGGIWNASNSPVVIRNTIIGVNSVNGGGAGGTNYYGAVATNGTPGVGTDGNGLFSSQGFNLIGTAGGVANFTKANGDLLGNDSNPLDPKLSPLQMNGGNLPTVALLPGSPAIDAGDDTILGAPEYLIQDQRGSPRLSGSHVDIGAFEYDGMLNGSVMPPLLVNNRTVDGGLQFQFNGATGLKYSIWASSDLATWVNLGPASETSQGWFFYEDVNFVNTGHRFYQVRYP